MHKADGYADEHGNFRCKVCGQFAARVPGGRGPVWLHRDSGTVTSPDPPPHVYEQVPGDPAIRVCVAHNPEFGLYGDEECHQGEAGYAAHAWRDIADLLAARLETHAPFGAGEEGEEDAAALRIYQAAVRSAARKDTG